MAQMRRMAHYLPIEPRRYAARDREPGLLNQMMTSQEVYMTCGELMTKEVASCDQEERCDIAVRLMRDRNVGTLVVVARDKCPIGIITDRDFAVSICASAEDSYYKTVKELMHSPVICCKENDDVAQVCSTMADHHIRRVPIVDGHGKLVGIISVDDLARSLDSDHGQSLLTSVSVVGTIKAPKS